jgi:hypothetical protein
MMVERLVLTADDSPLLEERNAIDADQVEVPEVKWLDAASLDVSILTTGVRKVHKMRCDWLAKAAKR